MRYSFHPAAAVFLLGAMTAHAQISNPDTLIGQPPHAPQQHGLPNTTEDPQWLWQFTKPAPLGEANALRLDARFQALLSDDFKQPQSMWGPPNTQEPLISVIPLFLSKYGTVTAAGNRYVTVDGCVPSFCAASGLLWFDLGTQHPLAVFAAVNWDSEGHDANDPKANYNLWLFSSRNIDPNALPFALTEAIASWNIRLAAAHRLVPHIGHAVLIEPDGSPYALDPQLTGANTIASQPDMLAPAEKTTP
jgi:hypothetical protein